MAKTLTANLAQLVEQLTAEYWEKQATVFDLFNQNSAGALILESGETLGQSAHGSIWDAFDSVVRRDLTDTGDYTPEGPAQTDVYCPVLSRKQRINVGISALKNMGINPETLTAGEFAQKIAEDETKVALDSALNGLVGCLSKASGTYNDLTGLSAGYTISGSGLVDTAQLLGDKSGSIVAWVMHSGEASKLRKEFTGTVATNTMIGAGMGFQADQLLTQAIGKPVLVTDNGALSYAVSSTVTGYRTLGLTSMAGALTRKTTLDLSAWIDRRGTNASISTDGEYEEKLRVKGFSYNDYANGNPLDATLATSSKWTQAVASVKHGAGVMLLTK